MAFLFSRIVLPCLLLMSIETSQLLAAADAANVADTSTNRVEDSVVKIFATVRNPDPFKPWTKQTPTEAVGTGVVLDGKRILTCAHVVSYASEVEVQANESGDRVSATVEYIGYGMDLAILKLDDASFFDKHPPLQLAEHLPHIRDTVTAYGYPVGGTSLSITRGVISRIEFASYNFPAAGLRIQIDAALNPGNSGGPATVGNKMIGLAFSLLGSAQNIGYIIPAEEIQLFLKDIADGHYDGKPTLYDTYQSLENPALRDSLKLDKSVEGVRIHTIDDPDPKYPLKAGDIITEIGDVPIDNQGMIQFNSGLRVFFRYGIQRFEKNGKVPLTIIRGGKEMTLDVPVSAKRPMVIPELDGAYPSYFIYGPLVFSAATDQYTSALASIPRGGIIIMLQAATSSPLITRVPDRPAFEGEGLVVVASPLFPHRLAKGYANPVTHVVRAVNGVPVKNLKHLVELLRDSKSEFITFEFWNRTSETMVFPRAEMNQATEEILTDNGIRSQGSPDTMTVWNAKSAN